MSSTVPASPRRATSRRLIGRDVTLARLEQAYAKATCTDRAVTVLVDGPAGIGKSRVVDELGRRVTDQGAQVLVGHCVPLGEEVFPYAPVAELLRGLVAGVGTDAVRAWAGPSSAELARLVPALGAHSAPPHVTTASVGRLLQACCSLFEAMSAEQPVVLVVEDLHWADRSTRDLLSLLTQQLRGNLLLVLTLRTDESPRDAGVGRLVAELGRRTADHIGLPPLTRPEQARQLSDILGVPPTTALLDEVYSRAEGNPFFAEELLALNRGGDLPPTVRDLLLARLDSLGPVTRQVLRAGAVIGRSFPHPLIEAVAGLGRAQLEASLRQAVEAHVLVTVPGSSAYEFRHALLQEAVAHTLLPGESVRIHRQVAEALEAHPDLAGDVRFASARIARHWLAAGDGPGALVASLAAAREAKRALLFSEALAHHERVLDLLGTVPDGDQLIDEPRHQLLRSAAESAHLAAEPRRAAELIRDAIAEVDPSDALVLAHLHERLGRYLWMSADGRGCLAACERAVSLLPDGSETHQHASVLSGYAQILMLCGRYPEAEAYATRAIEIAESLPGARSVEGHARNNLGVALARQGRLEDGIAELVAARRIAEDELDDVDDIARAVANLASILGDAGRVAEWAEVSREAIGIVDRLGLGRRKGVWCRCDGATALVLLGRCDEAAALLEEARSLVPSGVDAFRTHLVSGQMLLRLGSFTSAADELRTAHSAASHLVDGQLIGPLLAGLVEVATWQGDHVEARRRSCEAADRLHPEEDPVHVFPAYSAAVAAAVEEHLSGRRTRPHLDLSPWFDRIEASRRGPGHTSPLAAAHEATARCEAARATGTDPASQWLFVVDAWEDVGDPYRASYARARAAAAMLRDGGDRAQAAHLLGRAHGDAQRIGASHLVDLAADLARRARLRAVGEPARNPFRLTAREREVLALVADGLADRDIGARLFISHRTVERHVSNLLAKLDASRRAELTSLAHRLDLVGADAVPRPATSSSGGGPDMHEGPPPSG
ncbi:AAA family ATPase [Nocardioides sp. GCM10027113]|uniref:helix-turn-helix transcriptional regulator n=1 Tax=unclassified Nocardioides TaxID=2615069 RepID=UPI00362397F6